MCIIVARHLLETHKHSRRHLHHLTNHLMPPPSGRPGTLRRLYTVAPGRDPYGWTMIQAQTREAAQGFRRNMGWLTKCCEHVCASLKFPPTNVT